MKRIIALVLTLIIAFTLVGCDGASQDTQATIQAGNSLQENQPTPTDIDFSLQRYNLIRRAYVLNGQEEKARNLPCEVEKPLWYIYLFVEGVGCIARDTVDGQVTSLQTYLTPDSEYYESTGTLYNEWVPDIDGTYGENVPGIFWFTVDGSYKEWNGTYFLSSDYYEIGDPILQVVVGEEEN